MVLEVSEINRTSYSLCWAGHQGMLFLQRKMGKIWNVALQICLFFLKNEEPTSSAGGNIWGLCCLFSPCCIKWVLQSEGRAGSQFWNWNFSCKETNRSTDILHYRQFSVTERLQLVWPGVMGSKSSLKSPVEPLDCGKKSYSHSSNLGLLTLPISSASIHPLLP